jgi:hypothetical protein
MYSLFPSSVDCLKTERGTFDGPLTTLLPDTDEEVRTHISCHRNALGMSL